MSSVEKDEKFMRMALELAQSGFEQVGPNPMVGCVVVKDDEVIGQGYHTRFGEAHAEPHALKDCQLQGRDPAGATMYVTLEPCCHEGKTGPCTDLIIAAKIGRVVIAVEDPTEKVGGKGISQLRKSEIEVTTGVCEEQARLINRDFFRYAQTGRPWVVLKWAQSKDGYVSGAKERWISNERSREDVHRLRRSCQGILVGIGTVVADDPLLTPRPSAGRTPLRIVLDSTLRIPFDCKILNTHDSPTLIVSTLQSLEEKDYKAEMLLEAGWDVLAVANNQGHCNLDIVLQELGKRGVQKLLVEGGPTVIESFLAEGLADEVRIYVAPKELGEHGTVEVHNGMLRLTNGNGLLEKQELDFAGDTCITGLLRSV